MKFLPLIALFVLVLASCNDYARNEENDPEPLSDTSMNITGEIEDTTTLAPADSNALHLDSLN